MSNIRITAQGEVPANVAFQDGLTVIEAVRAANIHKPNANFLVNGRQVQGNHILQPGDRIDVAPNMEAGV